VAERGEGRGLGYTINVPLPPGDGDGAYAAALDQFIVPAARAYQPQLVLVSAGFDAHAADPLANMRLTEEGFAVLARQVVALAEEFAEGRLVAVLEGGYQPEALTASVVATLAVLDRDDASFAEDQAGRNGDAPG
jgi:acetoin utilization deacetylase AcuC-like enzyme